MSNHAATALFDTASAFTSSSSLLLRWINLANFDHRAMFECGGRWAAPSLLFHPGSIGGITGTDTDTPIIVITPAAGIGQTQLGMFNISIAPVHVTDTILNLQIIVSAAAQPQGDFTAFIFIGNLAPGMGLPNVISFASCDAVQANQAGQALTVQVAGAVNSVTNPFTVSRVFDKNLWPGGNCPIGDSIARTR